jgi:serine/threonine protein phosphatase PrpC
MLKKTNQDAMVMVEHAATKSLLVAVFDGHGAQGHDVSGFIARTFVTLLLQDRRFSRSDTNLCVPLRECLLAAEKAMLDESSIDASLSGSTAAAAILRGRKLWAIGVGDSRIVLGSKPAGARSDASSKGIVSTGITVDHKPDDPAEKRRILNAGGRVMATRNRMAPHIVGPARVWLRDVPAPGLAMSRSIGDLVAKAAGVISKPDEYVVDMDGSTRALLLASDGLWDFVSNQESIEGAMQAANDSKRLAELDAAAAGTVAKPDSAAEAQDAARALMRVARARWLQRTGGSDDITILCVLMKSE